MLEVRLREHDAVVDVFVPIEGTHTHSGSPKPLHWRDNLSSEPRFARFLPRIRGHVANLTLSPSDLETLSDKEAALVRECTQRDAALEALVGLGAKATDLVLVSDADEIGRRRRLEELCRCAEWVSGFEPIALEDALFPTTLEMNWHTYDFRWKSKLPWGWVAKEGAVLLEAQALGVGGHVDGLSRTSSDWRRMLRTDRQVAAPSTRASYANDGGWHLSSFGGLDAVAAKLEAYIEAHVYNSSFYRDRRRLARLVDGGIGRFQGRDEHALIETLKRDEHPEVGPPTRTLSSGEPPESWATETRESVREP